jgi:hypothetical protein
MTMSEMPDPPDLESVRFAIKKLEEIERALDLAVWSDRDLATLDRACSEALDPLGGIKHFYVDFFFIVRGRLKPLVRRLAADEPKWADLARALAINVRPPKPLGDSTEQERALEAMSRPWIRLRRQGWRSNRPLRPSWTEEEIELIRAMIYANETHPHKFSRSQASKFRRAGDDLAAVLRYYEKEIHWKLVADALDADVNRNFIEHFTGIEFGQRFFG